MTRFFHDSVPRSSGFGPSSPIDRRSFLAGVGATALATTWAPPLAAAPALPPLVARRSKSLSRGLTASLWFEWAPSEPKAQAKHLERYRAEDFAQIRALGFDHVRVSIQPGFIAPKLRHGDPTLDPRRLALLDKAMAGILDQGLALVLDCHADTLIKDKMAREDKFRPVMATWWQGFARHVHGHGQYPAERVFLELLNEPEASFDNQAHYRMAIEGLAAAARRGAPGHTLIVGGNRMNIAEALFQGAESKTPGLSKPLADTNMVYTFHFYLPMEFTHQAMPNTPRYAKLKGVPWNVDAGALSEQDIAREDPAVRAMLERYNSKPRRKNDLRWQFAEVHKWSQKHGVFVWLGEFGVFNRAADPAQRAAWVRDVRELAEEYGFGWCHWEARGGFGLFKRVDERPWVVNTELLAALGMPAAGRAK